jgi:hypothetical protein
LKKLRPLDGCYYDLVRVPHGHVPVTKVGLWLRLPLPVKDLRGEDYFECPRCGEPSFFHSFCFECDQDYSLGYVDWRWSRSFWRRQYFRRLLKSVELLFLPILVLLGRAWYVESLRPSTQVRFCRRSRRWF